MNKVILVFVALAFSTFVFQGCGEKNLVKAEKRVEIKKKKVVTKKTLSKADIMEIRKAQMYASSAKKQKNWKKLIRKTSIAINLDPEFKTAKKFMVYWRALGYEALGKADSAKIDFEKFHALDPSDKSVAKKLEYIYSSNNEIDKAIAMCKKLIKLEPENNLYFKKIGLYYYSRVKSILEDDPESDEVKEDAEKSIEWLSKYNEKNSTDSEINNLLTALIKKYQDLSVLKAKYEKNLAQNPDDVNTMLKLAKIYMDENKQSAAEKLLLKIHKVKPNDILTLRMLIKINKSNVSKSIKYNKMAEKVDNSNEIYNINLAKLYRSQKKYVAARAQCKKALAKNPNKKSIYKSWARIYTDAVANHSGGIEYQDQLVFAIAYGLYKKAGDIARMHSMKDSGQVPSKMDYYSNKTVKRPTRKAYRWMNKNWNEVKYIDKYIKTLK